MPAKLPSGMAFLHRGHLWFGLLALIGCGGDERPPGPACENLGLLCADQDGSQSLDVVRSKGVTGDLDGDGYRDLVTASASGLSIVWSLAGQREYQLLPGGVSEAELGDLDGDGDLDIVFVTAEPGALRVLENRGARQFADGPALTLAGRPQSLWLGQLDGDDTLDAVVASGGEGTLTVVTAGLTRAEPIAVGRDLAAVELGDLDGDGHLDIVAVDRGDAAVHVALANDAGFAAPTRYATGLAPAYLQIYDLDGDGALDVLTHGRGAEIWFHQGGGAGDLAYPRGLVVQDRASAGFGAHRDEQGRRWLLTTDYYLIASALDDEDRVVRRVVAGRPVQVDGVDMDAGSPMTHGPGIGRRYSLAPSHVFTELWHGGSWSSQHALALGDLDQDGELDLVSFEDDVVVRLQLPDGSWGKPRPLATTNFVVSLAIADVTGDGVPDIVIGDDAPSMYVAIGAGDGSFTIGPPAPLDNVPYHLYAGLSAPGQATGVAASGHDVPGVEVLRFDPVGAVLDRARPLTTGYARTLTSADIDADGDEDLITFHDEGEDEAASLVIVPRVEQGWGPTHTRSLSALHIEGSPDHPLQNPKIVVGDIDLDERIDAVLVASNTVVHLLDIAADAPPPPQLNQLPGIPYPDALALADIDEDGLPDLVTCGSDLRIVLMPAGGALSLQAPMNQLAYGCTLHVDPASGQATAALATDRGVSVQRPDFAPALEPSDAFVGGPAALRRLVTGDIDADGYTDIVVSDEPTATLGGNAAVLWGHADGKPRRATWYRDLFNRAEFAVAPLDDQPGDDIVMAWGPRGTEIWTHADGRPQARFFMKSSVAEVAAVGVQARADGRSDVILLARTYPEALGLVALPRGADGDFIADAEVQLWSWPGPYDESAKMTIADFDGDGFDDFAVLTAGAESVNVVWGDRPRSPTAPLEVAFPDALRIASADLDEDGAAELVLATREQVARIAFPGRKPTKPTTLPEFAAADGLLLTDLAGDGHTDLLGWQHGELNIVQRSPTGDSFAQLGFASLWSELRAADLDGDGILDLVGLRDGNVMTRLSTGSAVPPP